MEEPRSIRGSSTVESQSRSQMQERLRIPPQRRHRTGRQSSIRAEIPYFVISTPANDVIANAATA